MLKVISTSKVVLLLTLIAGLTVGCKEKAEAPSSAEAKPEQTQTDKHANENGRIHLTTEEQQRAGVKVEEARLQNVQDQLVLTANIVANQDRLAHVTPRVEGKLVKVTAKLGDQVKAGAVLAEIDSIQMGEARAEYRRTQSELNLAKANFERIDRLYRQEVVPQKQWLEVKSTYERAQSAARAEMERLRMYGGLGHQEGSTFSVTAPFSGVVIEKNVVMGELAKPSDTIFTIADMSTVWIEADVAEKDIGKLALGKRASVSVTGYPEDTFQGKVSYISSTVNRETRTIKARIELPNQENKLRIDMFARASIELSGGKPKIVVPREAVLLLQGQNTIYVAVQDGYEARPVEIGDRLAQGIVITSGLKPTEKVVVEGAYALKARQLKSQISDEH